MQNPPKKNINTQKLHRGLVRAGCQIGDVLSLNTAHDVSQHFLTKFLPHRPERAIFTFIEILLERLPQGCENTDTTDTRTHTHTHTQRETHTKIRGGKVHAKNVF